ILMLIAWVLLVGITTVIARFYKSIFPGKLLCGTNVWFQIHRTVAMISFVITAASFVLIFVKVDGLSDRVGVHSWLGIGVMCGVSLQLIGGILRPNQDSHARSVFNVAHRYLGKSVHALAAATCLVVFNADYLPRAQRTFGNIMLCIWIGVQVVWESLFEAHKCHTPDHRSETLEIYCDMSGSPQ
ncbi:putative ferric-chelate reductase 1, partial [Mizuhopecten yessoensis]|uniref:putative ferric-chelate reductase 1 n=1 Tax=Mizuhopecten yessoensis TaxID=6573 RepID=UPI000B45A938